MSDPTPPEPSRPCSRCRSKPSTMKSRGNPLCDGCYLHGIVGKVLKPMAEYKVRGKTAAPRRLMLALSMGVSSMSLLHILATTLKQSVVRVGRYGYTLDVLVIDDTSVFQAPEECGNVGGTGQRVRQSKAEQAVQQMRDLAKLFPQTEYPMILSFAWKSTEVCFNSLAQSHGRPELEDLFKSLHVSGPPRSPDDANASKPSENTSSITSHTGKPSSAPSSASPYRDYIASLASRSARADANTTITRRFMVEHAKQNQCEAILWGDSTTRLAERTLAEASKGRGALLPWLTADGPTPLGVDFVFPLRDILRRELTVYADLAMTDDGRPLKASIPAQDQAQASSSSSSSSSSASASSKDMTIDALMAQYFTSVEANYPAIVANVVRTANKLAPAGDVATPLSPSASPCQLCGLPVAHGTQGLHSWAGSQEGDESVQSAGDFLCYGCARTTKGRRR